MRPLPAVPRRAGFTLVEMMFAVVLTTMVFAVAVPFFRQQANAIEVTSGRGDASQSARYAQNAIDRDLRLAGGITGQPLIVQAAPFALTFNVDLVSRVANDPSATYYNPNADSLGVESWEPSRARALPTSSKVYPTQFYTDANGVQSPAETISYFLRPDSSTGRSDLYTLFRRVNDRDSTTIARNLWIPADTGYFFKYYRTDASGAISQIAAGSLPLYWDNATHVTDSIRVVSMRVAGFYNDVKKGTTVTRTIYHNTRLINAGMLQLRTCGTAPLGPQAVTAVKDTTSSGSITDIRVTWTPSLEEAGGEKDVATYLIQRRLSTSSDWEVLGNLAANGSASYSFLDFNFRSGTWVYGVVAQDCSPLNSSVTAATALTNP